MAAYPARATPDRLLDAAVELFASRGFHGTSIRDIAVRRWSSLRKLMPGGSFNAQPIGSPDVYEGDLTWDFAVERVTGIEPALSA